MTAHRPACTRTALYGLGVLSFFFASCGGLEDYTKYLDSGSPVPDEDQPQGAADTGFSGGSGSGSGGGSGSGSGSGDAGSGDGPDGSDGAEGSDGSTAPITIAIDSVTPDYGVTTGGASVVLEGGPFDASARVLLAGTEATVLSHTESTITVSTPASSITGAVMVQVESDLGSGRLPRAFRYWEDGTGLHGMVGAVELVRYTGSYWTDASPPDELYASVYFSDLTTFRWYEFLAPTLDACRSETWTSSAAVSVFNPGFSSIRLRPNSGSTLTLNHDGYGYTGEPSSLTAGGRYDLVAPGGDLPDEDVSQIFRLPSSGPSVSSPSINSSVPPEISQYQTFTWTPGGADWVIIAVALNNGLTADGFEQVTCGVYDDGSFTLDGSQFTTWTRGAVAIVTVGFVYDQSGATLPWNLSNSAVAGIVTTKGGAYSY